MKNINKIIIVATAALLCACSGEKFRIVGNITDAKDSVLYLENVGLDGIAVIDSAKLDETGGFEFSDAAPEAPEFYRLRIDNQIINVSIDSTETVTVKASLPTMSSGYTIDGSENCEKIRELTLKQQKLVRDLLALQENVTMGTQLTRDSMLRVIDEYKEDVKRNYIYKAPMRAYAYFALFQTIGNQLIFDPSGNREDNKAYAAVATSWDTYYPNALRGKNLHNIALEGMKNVRMLEQKGGMQVDPSIINTTNIINIELLDNKGNMRRLTDLAGKVVLLDFHVFATQDSPQRIMLLRDLYNKYHDQGFEIFQVSLDNDEHFWKQQTAALPWISVRSADGMDSDLLIMYNVQRIPTFFLVDRTNTLHKRDAQIEDLDAEIKSLL
ncbi:MAG: redoxin domain-containing protein [Prevotella sp.]|nr:redoxin domain-containing protein [Prevotella sp.]